MLQVDDVCLPFTKDQCNVSMPLEEFQSLNIMFAGMAILDKLFYHTVRWNLWCNILNIDIFVHVSNKNLFKILEYEKLFK